MNAGSRERARDNSNGNATQDVERLAIHRGIDADLGLREVKRDAKCSPENRTAPETEDIARILSECHKKHPDTTLSYVVLKEAVRASLSRKTLEHWPYYKEDLKAAFQRLPTDTSVLFELAAKFAKACTDRDTLVQCEKRINAGTFDRIHELIQKAQDGGQFPVTRI